MKNTIKILFLLLIFISTVISCKKKDDPKPSDPQNNNEEELITTLKLILTEDGTSNVSTFQFADLDGSGGNAPTVDNIVLEAGKTYHGKIILLDQTKSPADSISNEVEEEADEHQFFFEVTTANLTISYTDFDSHGVPLGLFPDVVTGAASSGTLKVTLKHQPELKPTSGMGDSTKGETDVEVTFNVTIN
jgi:hypothetical protein